jgi:mRNA interferase MazF
MRPIHLARIDKVRPVLVLTREVIRPHLRNVTVAAITSTIRGISSELPVGLDNGLHRACVVSCDNIHTIPVAQLLQPIGYLLPHQEPQLTTALKLAFDLH